MVTGGKECGEGSIDEEINRECEEKECMLNAVHMIDYVLL